MFQPVPRAVYRCIRPVKSPRTTPSTVYHTPHAHSGKAPQVFYYLAWPDIDDPDQPCCLPFLWRALYDLDLDVLVELADVAAIAEEYVSHQEVIAPEIRQQTLAIVKAHYSLLKSSVGLVESDVLSPGGEYGKKRQLPADTHSYIINFFRTLYSGHVDHEVTMHGAIQGIVYGYLANFPGARDGDFTAVFSLLHECVHNMAKLSYSAVVQDEWSMIVHKTLDILISYPLSPEEINEQWARFWESNSYASGLTYKFEPIEESFATYLGMHFLPTELRYQIEASLEDKLKEKHWNNAYKAFVKACENSLCLYSPLGAALLVFETVCRILEKVNIDSTKLLCTFAKIRKVIWSYVEVVKQENNNNLDKTKLEAMAERETFEEINRILEQEDIPHEVYWSAVAMEKNSVYRRLSKSIINDFSLSEEELRIFFAPLIKLVGKPSLQEITPVILSLGFQQEDADKLSPSIRVLCESLRQQLSRGCGLFCAFARKGKPCCGLKEAHQRLYDRLPEKHKEQYSKPNCDDFRSIIARYPEI